MHGEVDVLDGLLGDLDGKLTDLDGGVGHQ